MSDEFEKKLKEKIAATLQQAEEVVASAQTITGDGNTQVNNSAATCQNITGNNNTQVAGK
tara:strand:- start:328 stop:507 length:180 start_codon:yes stop_codon:yes gene_type:complete